MKIIKWIGHPVIVICTFLLLITEGENFGGFYVLYLILALPHGALYAILASIGIASIVLGFNIQKEKLLIQKQMLYLIGLLLMITSLINFFLTGNQLATFQETVPLLTFVIYGVCCLCFFVSIIYHLNQHLLNKKFKLS